MDFYTWKVKLTYKTPKETNKIYELLVLAQNNIDAIQKAFYMFIIFANNENMFVMVTDVEAERQNDENA